jgi:D-arabinose 5-phosphate isomerase GutQ
MTDRALWEKATHTWRVGSYELSRLADTVDPDAFIRCVKALARCKGKIVTSGAGTSAAAARKIAHSLSCIERPAFFLEPADAVHGALGSVQKDDAAIFLSKGGGTREITAMIPAVKAKKALLIGVTENEDSVLARESDLLLKVRVQAEADAFNMLATTSTMAVVAAFDAVCIALMEYTGYTKEQFAVIHPHGAVGERLKGRGRLREAADEER